MSKYYLDLTNFSTGYGKLARRVAKATDRGDFPEAATSLAKLSYKTLRREPRDPQNKKMTRLQMAKLERKVDRPIEKMEKNQFNHGKLIGYMENRYPKLTKIAHDD